MSKIEYGGAAANKSLRDEFAMGVEVNDDIYYRYYDLFHFEEQALPEVKSLGFSCSWWYEGGSINTCFSKDDPRRQQVLDHIEKTKAREIEVKKWEFRRRMAFEAWYRYQVANAMIKESRKQETQDV